MGDYSIETAESANFLGYHIMSKSTQGEVRQDKAVNLSPTLESDTEALVSDLNVNTSSEQRSYKAEPATHISDTPAVTDSVTSQHSIAPAVELDDITVSQTSTGLTREIQYSSQLSTRKSIHPIVAQSSIFSHRADEGEVHFDTARSWLIFIVILTCSFSSVGFLFGTASVFAGEYPKLLNMSSSRTNLIGSTLTGTFLLSSPLMTPLCERFGSQRAVTAGSVLVLTGISVQAFCVRLWQFVLAFSIPVGIGSSLCLSASLQIIPHYFIKYQNIALAALGLGSATGVLVFPLVMNAILSKGTSFNMTTLYLLAICSVLLTAPLFYIKRMKHPTQKAENKINNFTAPLMHRFSIPFLLQTYAWNAGFIGFLVILFTQVSSQVDDKAGSLSATAYGGGQVLAGLMMPLAMLNFDLNYTMIHILSCLLGGAAVLPFGLLEQPNVIFYYICSGIVGLAHSAVASNAPCLSFFVFRREESVMAFSYQLVMGGIAGIVSPLVTAIILNNYGGKTMYVYLSLHLFGSVLINILIGMVEPSYVRGVGLQPNANRVEENDPTKFHTATEEDQNQSSTERMNEYPCD